MIKTKNRKAHTPEFKAKIGLEALRGIRQSTKIGPDFGVHPLLVGQ